MSKIGVIADIHGNLPTLKKALDILEAAYIDQIVVCGDIVGYGTSPNECCDGIRALNCPVVAGNHDYAVADLTEYKESHSTTAVEGINYTKKVISEDNLRWLQSLPLHYKEYGMEFVHASLIKADKWHYLTHRSSFLDTDWHDIGDNFKVLKGQIGFVGHSHRPTLFLEKRRNKIQTIYVNLNKDVYMLKGRRAIIDAGSVGLPRGNSKQSSLVIYDTENQIVYFKRFTCSDNSGQPPETVKKEMSSWISVKRMIQRWFRRNATPSKER